MKKSICVQLSDEVKKSYAWLAEIKQQNNSESLVEEALEYILSLDSELEKDGESDLSRILKRVSREKIPENIISDKEECPSSICLDEEVINRVKEKFKEVYYENKYIHISFILKNSLKAYALHCQDNNGVRLSLKEFISICNKCNFELLKKSPPSQDKNAKKLAKVFVWYEEKNMIEEMKDEDKSENHIFYERIRDRIDGNNYYKFLQEDKLYAEIDALEPYIYLKGRNNKVLNQKWHVLIAWLAFLDMASFDEEFAQRCRKNETFKEKWVKGKIEYIRIKKDNIYIESIKDGKQCSSPYPSKYMREWIWEAIESDRRLKTTCQNSKNKN